MKIQSVKQRFGIIGDSPLLNRAIEIACQVAPTDMSVLITGESGVGKEFFPKILHHLSSRKHGAYIAINCGAIPEGTIDSELFGHEKGSFTDAHEARKGYFEVANGGTIFLDEVAELPLSTQVRLLRVLETGEFIKVGSSKVIKTNVRVVAATNVNITEAIQKGKFREDLYYRLNSVPIYVPSLKQRKEDIELLFKKFALEFAEKYHIPPIHLNEQSRRHLVNYQWQGNIRQLKNITEQISIIETDREINVKTLTKYLPEIYHNELPVLYENTADSTHGFSERELLYKVLFDMKNDINELKKTIGHIVKKTGMNLNYNTTANSFYNTAKHVDNIVDDIIEEEKPYIIHQPTNENFDENKLQDEKPFKEKIIEKKIKEKTLVEKNISLKNENLSIQKKEYELIRKAILKYKGNRGKAAQELGISERTLYRKIKELGLE
jgi:DNA-binding NtrC family response regulator